MDISGKVALVTGAARRVGRAVAIELARSGCDVAIHCHKSIQDADGLRTAIQTLGRRAAVLKGDLADPAIPDRLVADTVSILGRLDILVNNASIFDKIPLEEAEADRWERMLRINTVAPALLIRAAAPIMRSAGAGTPPEAASSSCCPSTRSTPSPTAAAGTTTPRR